MPRRSRYRRESPFALFAFQDIIAAVTGVMILLTMLLILELVTQVIGDPTAAQAQPADLAPNAPSPSTLEELTAQRNLLVQQVSKLNATNPHQVITQTQLDVLANTVAALQARLQQQQQQLDNSQNQQQTTADANAAARAELQRLIEQVQQTQQQAEAERQLTRVTLLDGDTTGKQPWFLLCAANGVTAARVTPQHELTRVATFLNPQANALTAWIEQRSPQRDVFVLLVQQDGVERFENLQRRLRQLRFEVGWDLASPEIATMLAPRQEAGAP